MGVSILVIGHQLWLRARGWQFNALSPYFMCDLMIFFLIGVGSAILPLPHRSFTDELLFNLFILSGLIAYYIGLHMPVHMLRLKLPFVKLSLQRLHAHRRLVTFFLLTSLVAIISITLYQRIQRLNLSLSEMFALTTSQLYTRVATEGLGALFVILTYLITVMILVHLYFLIQKRHYFMSLLTYISVIVSTALIASTRIPIVMSLAIPIAYYHYAVRRINQLILILIFVGGPLMLTLLHGVRGGNLLAWTVSARLVEELGVLKSFHALWQRYIDGQLDLEYGSNYYYYSLIALVPRIFWQDKPQVSFETRWTINLFGAIVDEGGQIWVHTFTPWGEGVVQFGWIGGALNLFLYGLILNLANRFFNQRPYSCIVYFFYAVLAATFIRTSVQALLFTTVLYVAGVLLYERWLLPPTVSKGGITSCM